ncbi:MAG: ParB N-terminal domain-containing protein [Longimicrobiaceae bacterium]
MKIESAPIDSLRPDPDNPRLMSRHDGEALKRSLAEYGAVEPAVVNQDGQIIGGHMRIAAARELGWTEFPVIRVDLAPARAKLLNLALNRISGEWDTDKLSELLYDLGSAGADLGLSGFEADEIEKLLADVSPVGGEPEPPKTCEDCGKALA